jgi:hypothetical protein
VDRTGAQYAAEKLISVALDLASAGMQQRVEPLLDDALVMLGKAALGSDEDEATAMLIIVDILVEAGSGDMALSLVRAHPQLGSSERGTALLAIGNGLARAGDLAAARPLLIETVQDWGSMIAI